MIKILGIRLLAKKRLLPRFVSSFRDRHGKERCRFRKVGSASYYFEQLFGTEGFREEYRRCLDSIPTSKAVRRTPVTPRSIDDLVVRYLQSGDFKRDAKPVTLSKNRAIIERFRKEYGELPADQVKFEHLDKIIARARVKQGDGRGGDFAAQKLRKELKRLFRYAVKLGWLANNPVDFVDPIAPHTDGFHTWTEQEIAAYQNYWVIGTRQRLAMEIMLWTAKRVGHVAELGPQHVKKGYLETCDPKTQKWNQIAIMPDLKHAIAAMPQSHLCFIVTEFGKPYSVKGLSQAFSGWCREAGLTNCTAHGLRKAIARRMAENGITNREMKSITMHSGDAELAVYTRNADQKSLAERALLKVHDAYKDG
jgi:integrase